MNNNENLQAAIAHSKLEEACATNRALLAETIASFNALTLAERACLSEAHAIVKAERLAAERRKA